MEDLFQILPVCYQMSLRNFSLIQNVKIASMEQLTFHGSYYSLERAAPGNKGGSITVPFTSCLTGLD
jgi:hypothetical protein